PGTWYMYKGIGICNEITHTMGGPVTLMATGVMKTTETTWALSTFGSTQFAAGDYITMSRCPLVPEPGSMVAMLSGLIGLAGFSIRRRK
ncbi:MAG: PEP-CTERM sorting domain-containing protein, partial [Armatimonadetes bacterium]|nr:PEP-CTERM sorting domain-containing protein [Armatimonadota bacterium]